MRRLHPLSAVARILETTVQFGAIGFFAGIVGGEMLGLIPVEATIALVPFFALVGVAYGTARYLRFTYDLSGGTLSVASGVFDRQERDIPLGRIQNVDVRRGLLQRLFGLATVNFETAGGSGTEAVLNAIGVEEAERLQRAVAAHRREGRRRDGATPGAPREAGDRLATEDEAGTTAVESAERPDESAKRPDESFERPAESADRPAESADRPAESADRPAESADRPDESSGTVAAATSIDAATEPDGEQLYELPMVDLLTLAAVSIRPAAPAIVLFGIPFADDLAFGVLSASVEALGGPTLFSAGSVAYLPTGALALVVAVALVEFLLAAWIASTVLTLVEYYDFRLERVGDDLRYERGLLQRYSGAIPLEKVQTVTVRENVLMRPFGFAALAVETAGYSPGSGDGRTANTAIPLDDASTVVALAESLGEFEYPTVERPPRRAARRYAIRYSLIPVGTAVALLAVDATVTSVPWWPAVLGAVPLTVVGGVFAWRHRGHALAADVFVARSGFWRRRTRAVPYYRVQTVIGTRTVFQRFRDLASVTADTASTASIVGGDATAHDVDEATARQIHRALRDRLHEHLLRYRESRGRVHE